MGWRGYIHEECETVFFWSQKAACTTLFNFLADNMAERPRHKRHFHIHSRGYPACLRAIEAHGYRSVILARHPVTRVISAYFNKFCLYRGERLLSRDDLEPFAQALHDLWLSRTGRQTGTNAMNFEDFLDTVAHLHATRPQPRAPINGHWDTQVPPFHAELGLTYDTVVHVEALDAELGALARQLGLRYTPRAMNRTDLAGSPVKGYLGRVPAHELSGMDFGYDNFITRDTLKRVRAIYDVDFDMLGYPTDPRAGRTRAMLARGRREFRNCFARITGK